MNWKWQVLEPHTCAVADCPAFVVRLARADTGAAFGDANGSASAGNCDADLAVPAVPGGVNPRRGRREERCSDSL